MKTIILKTERENIIVNGRPQELDIKTSELLKTAINSPVKGGYSVSEMQTRLKLLNAVDAAEKAGTDLDIEDADFKALGAMVKDTKWAIISPSIIELSEKF